MSGSIDPGIDPGAATAQSRTGVFDPRPITSSAYLSGSACPSRFHRHATCGGAGLRDYGVVPAPAVRRYLVELDWDEREGLVTAIEAELRLEDRRTKATSTGFEREIYGYWITYRSLRDEERKREALRDGHVVLEIERILKGFPD